jgi:hypothetical protein
VLHLSQTVAELDIRKTTRIRKGEIMSQSQQELESKVIALEAQVKALAGQAGIAGEQEVVGPTAGGQGVSGPMVSGQAHDEAVATLQAVQQAALAAAYAAYAAAQRPPELAASAGLQQLGVQGVGTGAMQSSLWGLPSPIYQVYLNHSDAQVIALGGAAAAGVLAAYLPGWFKLVGAIVGAIAGWVKAADQGNGVYWCCIPFTGAWWIKTA